MVTSTDNQKGIRLEIMINEKNRLLKRKPIKMTKNIRKLIKNDQNTKNLKSKTNLI